MDTEPELAHSTNDFEFNVAYNNQIDFLSTELDNDGADNFFGLNPEQQMDFKVGLQHIKQEMMSPMPSSPGLNLSSSGSLSEYYTPCSILNSGGVGTPEREAAPQMGSLDVEEPDVTLVNNTVQDEVDVLHNALKDLHLSSVKSLPTPAKKSVKFDGLQLDMPPIKDHQMETRLDTKIHTPKLQLRTRSVTRISTGIDPALKKEDTVCSSALGKPPQEDPQLAVQVDNIRDVPFNIVRKAPPMAGVLAKRKYQPSPTEIPTRVKFSSMAEAMHKFHYGTPDRFRTLPNRADAQARKPPNPRGCQTMHNFKSTIPISPALQAKLRARPVHTATRNEVEEAECKEMEAFRNKVKALPLNPKVFKTPQLGKRVEKRVTAVQPFKLTITETKPKPNEPKFHFTARPVPKGILEGPVGIKEKPDPKVTEPVTPAFVRRQNSTKKLTRVDGLVEKDNETTVVLKEVYHFGIFKNSSKKKALVGTRRSTKIMPFSFEQRDHARKEKKEEEILKVLEAGKKAREFHANPLPRSLAGSRSSMEENQAILPNHMVISQLLGDGYAAKRQERIRKKLEDEKAQLKQMTIFKARPATVVRVKPFEVKLPEHPLQEIRPFDFNTERRAKEWNSFNKAMKAKEEEREMQKKRYDIEKEQQEKEELAKIRQSVVHKPRPVPKCQPLEILPSNKTLTDPQSPFSRSARKDID